MCIWVVRSASLGIRAFDAKMAGLVFVVARADGELLSWAAHRRGGTLMLVHGRDGAVYQGGVVLGRFPSASYCPLVQVGRAANQR